PLIQESFARRGQSPMANKLLYAEIKSVLENLRSVLDYAAHDIEEAVKPVASAPKGTDVYFPFVHPVSMKGKRKSEAEIRNEFKTKPFVQETSQRLPKVFAVLESVQGQQWLSDLIEEVNPQKHNNRACLGAKEVHIGSGGFVVTAEPDKGGSRGGTLLV